MVDNITMEATAAGRDISRPRPWLAVGMLSWREIVRFLRQRNRVVGALGQPLLFWLLFGAGMSRWFQVGEQNFSQYYLPGTIVLILLFTAIFATISIIEDRREGFLQSVLVAPIPRWSMVMGKVMGGSAIALGQSLVFVLLAMTLGIQLGLLNFLGIVALLCILAVTLTCLGFLMAWRMESTQGFHAIMNLMLMPMWLLSGAFFPVPSLADASGWLESGLHWVMRLNPVTYGVAGLRQLMFTYEVDSAATSSSSLFWLPSLLTCWIVSVVFGVVMLVAACQVAGWHTKGDLQ